MDDPASRTPVGAAAFTDAARGGTPSTGSSPLRLAWPRLLIGVKVVLTVVIVVLALGFVLSIVHGSPVLFLPVLAGFLIWTPLGLLLLMASLVNGIVERWRVRLTQTP